MFFTSQQREQRRKFLEIIRYCFLFQHVYEPELKSTRCCGTDDSSTVDLILTDEENQITGLQYQDLSERGLALKGLKRSAK